MNKKFPNIETEAEAKQILTVLGLRRVRNILLVIGAVAFLGGCLGSGLIRRFSLAISFLLMMAVFILCLLIHSNKNEKLMAKAQKAPVKTKNILTVDIVEKNINASLKNTHTGHRVCVIVCVCSGFVSIASILLYGLIGNVAIGLLIVSGYFFVNSLVTASCAKRKINHTRSYSYKIVRTIVTGTDWESSGEDSTDYFLWFGDFKFEVSYSTYMNAVPNTDEYYLLFLVWEDSAHELINIYSCEEYSISPELQINRVGM